MQSRSFSSHRSVKLALLELARLLSELKQLRHHSHIMTRGKHHSPVNPVRVNLLHWPSSEQVNENIFQTNPLVLRFEHFAL